MPFFRISSVRKTAGERHSSDRQNKNVSWISEIKDISNVAVRKKRGRRAPPSAKRLHGKSADKVINSDDAVDDDINDTDKGQGCSSQSNVHTEESADGRTGDPVLSKTDRSGDSSDGPSSAPEEDLSANPKDIIKKAISETKEKVPGSRMRSKQGKNHLKQEGVHSEPSDRNDLAAVKKGTDEERSSRQISNAVSFLFLSLIHGIFIFICAHMYFLHKACLGFLFFDKQLCWY